MFFALIVVIDGIMVYTYVQAHPIIYIKRAGFLYLNYMSLKSLKKKVVRLDSGQPNNAKCPLQGVLHFPRKTEPAVWKRPPWVCKAAWCGQPDSTILEDQEGATEVPNSPFLSLIWRAWPLLSSSGKVWWVGMSVLPCSIYFWIHIYFQWDLKSELWSFHRILETRICKNH